MFSDGQTQYGVPDPELGTYDLGDCWDHEILVEDVAVAEPGHRYPWCVTGKGACPPEDSGGVGGYQRLVEILADPGHDEHRFMLDWLGLDSQDQFDPARFDPDDANRRLAAESHAGFMSRR